MWTNLLANLMLAAGVLSAVVGLLDWLLSDRQKAAVEEGAYRVWDWLDDRRKIEPMTYLTSEALHEGLRFLLVFLFSLFIAIMIPWSILARIGIFIYTLVVYSFLVSVHYQGLFEKRLLEAKTTWGFIGQALLGIFLSLPVLLIGAVLHQYAGHFLVAEVGKALAGQGFVAILVAVWVLVLSFLAVLVIRVLRVVFGASEFVLRRLLEQKRGLLTATAAALGAVALLLKSFL